jgi:hypothetical protein
MGLLGAGLYASPTLLLRSDVSCFEPSVLWNRMSKLCSPASMVAERAPDETTVPLSVFEI